MVLTWLMTTIDIGIGYPQIKCLEDRVYPNLGMCVFKTLADIEQGGFRDGREFTAFPPSSAKRTASPLPGERGPGSYAQVLAPTYLRGRALG